MSEPAVLAEGLRKRFGETQALDGVDLSVRTGQGARPSRAQRCRQDDGRAHLHDADQARCRACLHRRHRRGCRTDAGQGAHRPHRPVRGRRRAPHRRREPRARRAPVPHARRGVPRAWARAARAVRSRRRRRPSRQGLLRWHAAAPRHRHEPDRPAVGPVPRRTDDRARPAQPPGRLGVDRGARRRRHHHPADDPVPRRGRPPGRRDRRHRPRPGDRRGDERRAQAAGRRRPSRRHGARRRRRRPRRRDACRPGLR